MNNYLEITMKKCLLAGLLFSMVCTNVLRAVDGTAVFFIAAASAAVGYAFGGRSGNIKGQNHVLRELGIQTQAEVKAVKKFVASHQNKNCNNTEQEDEESEEENKQKTDS